MIKIYITGTVTGDLLRSGGGGYERIGIRRFEGGVYISEFHYCIIEGY